MNRENLSKIDAAVIIAFLTSVSYGVAYAYEISYQKYYHLPDMFIELNINNITRVACFIFCFIILASLIIYGGISHELSVNGLEISVIFRDVMINAMNRVDKKIKKPFLLTVVIAFLFIIAIILGQLVPRMKTEYMVIKQKEDFFIAVGSYKENVILAPLNLKTESMEPKFNLIENNKLENTKIIKLNHQLNVEKVKKIKNERDFKKNF